MRLSLLKPLSFFTVLHGLLSLMLTPVHVRHPQPGYVTTLPLKSKLPKFTVEGYCSRAKVL